jgi:hypothetical protein
MAAECFNFNMFSRKRSVVHLVDCWSSSELVGGVPLLHCISFTIFLEVFAEDTTLEKIGRLHPQEFDKNFLLFHKSVTLTLSNLFLELLSCF